MTQKVEWLRRWSDHRGLREAYQFNFCVSGAIFSSTPSFSAVHRQPRVASPVDGHRQYGDGSGLTKVEDVVDASGRAALSPVLGLLVLLRGRAGLDGRVDLGEWCGIGGHGWMCSKYLDRMRVQRGSSVRVCGDCLMNGRWQIHRGVCEEKKPQNRARQGQYNQTGAGSGGCGLSLVQQVFDEETST